MHWKINGVDRETGTDRQIWLEASSSEEATNLAGDHNMMVSSVIEDAPVFKVVSQMPAGVIRVELDKRQLKRLRITQWDITVGVFAGLFLWSLFVFIVMVIFWSVIVVGIAGAAGGV